MKKRSSMLLFFAALIVVIFTFSTNSFAVKEDISYEDGQIISASDTLDAPYVTDAAESDIHYEDGQIISVSDTLDALYVANVAEGVSYEDEQTISAQDNSVTPFGFYLYKNKTIVVFYSNYYDVPLNFYYTEYTDGNWYSGHLPLTRTERTSNGWNATFSGTISAWVN